MKLACFFVFFLGISQVFYAQAIYLAKLQTLNPQINGTLAASTTLHIQNDRLLAYVRFFAGFPKTRHMQNVYVGNRCPTTEDDLNMDGFIDIEEGNKVWGNIIIPLDGNLNSQNAGSNIFPVADAYGAYFYEKEARLSFFLQDLRSVDLDLTDNIVKLESHENLMLEGKVVVIQGVKKDGLLPDTVASYGNYLTTQSLPIACGIIKVVPANQKR